MKDFFFWRGGGGNAIIMSNLETHLIIIKDIIKDAFKVIGGTFNEDSFQYMTTYNF